MNIPIEVKPALWGAVGGAVALAIVGFSWGGWQTSAKAEQAASMRADAAVVDALAPVCVARFKADPASDTQLAELRKADSWNQGEFIEKGGWAAVKGGTPLPQQSSVAKACAELLTKA